MSEGGNMVKKRSIAIPNNELYALSHDDTQAPLISTVVNHTGINIDFIIHTSGVIELRKLPTP